ncbi:hypothetical protein IU436_04395 [Nocardia farcinica]|uniref:hypothetical protein n=1 Tax=Nocardia farcinica TaxID=37329 RepID=UPI001896178C|nr:hypothetical protein [Nocardia farcinica]MBF6418112.1 hypothetical protein [Nocardia farcinica]MBF6429589.1 hypothetical protein [Nocardia farcinica]MBF6443015.1 hypothetical protein [Nocardia farcinica]MBF6500173.1 hypothetical protein [Nocardia farcinica]
MSPTEIRHRATAENDIAENATAAPAPDAVAPARAAESAQPTAPGIAVGGGEAGGAAESVRSTAQDSVVQAGAGGLAGPDRPTAQGTTAGGSEGGGASERAQPAALDTAAVDAEAGGAAEPAQPTARDTAVTGAAAIGAVEEAEHDPVRSGPGDAPGAASADEKTAATAEPGTERWTERALSVLRAVRRPTLSAVVVAVALLVAAAAVLAWRTDDAAGELAALRAQLDTDAAAQRVAADYALGVSQVQSGDLEAWRSALRRGVTEQLAAKLSAAVDVVGPWLRQVDYSATAEPLAATVQRRDGDLYVVQVFVDMTSCSSQTPEGVVATAAYTVTLNRAADWTITDVGGVAPDLPVPSADATPAPR